MCNEQDRSGSDRLRSTKTGWQVLSLSALLSFEEGSLLIIKWWSWKFWGFVVRLKFVVWERKKATLAVIFDSNSDKLSPEEEGEKKKNHKMSELLRFYECWTKVARKNDNTLNQMFLHLTAAGIITTVSDVWEFWWRHHRFVLELLSWIHMFS